MLASAAFAGWPTASGASDPALVAILARTAQALVVPGVPPLDRYVERGNLAGLGLTGTFTVWHDGDRERDDQLLGPQADRTLRLGPRYFEADANDDVRELLGPSLRHERTDALVQSGAFARLPMDCRLVGTAVVDGTATDVVEVRAPAGDPETVYLDRGSGIIRRIVYAEYDGRTTIDLSDWRAVGGRRFPFHAVVSSGDRAFDIVQTTTAIDPNAPIAASIFAPLQGRTIEMSAPQTLPLIVRDRHLFTRVRIGATEYTFLIDSGAQNILVDSALAARLHLDQQGALEASGTARTGGMRLARLPELAIGNGRLRDLVVSTLPLAGPTSAAPRIDGILGYPLFASALVQLDIAAGTMRIGPPGSFAPGGERLTAIADRALPEVELRVNGNLTAPFVIDTGNAADLLLYRPFVDAHPGVVPFSTQTRRSVGVGGATAAYETTLPARQFGGTTLRGVSTDVMLATQGAFADRFDAGNIGFGILRRFTLTFDLPDGALYVQPQPASSAATHP